MNTPLGRNRLLGIANLVATIATPSRVWLEGTKLLVTSHRRQVQNRGFNLNSNEGTRAGGALGAQGRRSQEGGGVGPGGRQALSLF